MIPFGVTAIEVCSTILSRNFLLDHYEQGCLDVCAPHLNEICFDFEGGPEGVEHRHPEEVFHQDFCQNPFTACHHH